ncbi:diacylglycerol kinase [Iodobacter sp. LRB]|uniref:Diacylglycerol kinase n=2 Tax=Iodobacter TaxID=32014 RepID=A0A377SW38_9NEIS|nr:MULTISPECIES: diacylglycerol kinase [Iodobacter]NHQ87039.1 diacylglycerol kinase [Iodobacter violacea]PHV03244.1 diacylglycerol kinase [Iodobacter sp. BJB302]TCU86288.1 diacylglycerol kinase [Iodobacter fluviatilis]STR44699.1 Diacylglycerol kinase [Iodobacter fluviatilis]
MEFNVLESPFKGKTGVARIFNALGYSIDGLKAGWLNEAAFRQVTLLALLGIPCAFLIPGLPHWGRALLIGSHLASMIVELLNSAIEAAVDHTSLERHELAKRAKDLGSAAQLVCLLNLALMWCLVVLG